MNPGYINQDSPLLLARRLSNAVSLAAMLRELSSALAHEMQGGDIAMINLHDDYHRLLKCVEVIFPPEMNNFRATFTNFVIPRDSDTYHVYESGQRLCITPDTMRTHSMAAQKIFEMWQARQLDILPIAPVGVAPAYGALLLISRDEVPTAERVDRIAGLLEDVAGIVRLQVELQFLRERSANVRDVEAELDSMLRFVAEASNLSSVDAICRRVLAEFCERFDMDMGAVWLREADLLRCVSLSARGVLPAWVEAWRTYVENTPISAVVEHDSTASFVYHTGSGMHFADLEKLRQLAVAEKDRVMFQLAPDLRSFSGHPIKQNQRSIGVLGLFSLRRTQCVSPEQMKQIGYWADFLGAIIDSAQTYDMLDARTVELGRSNAELACTLKELHATQAALLQSQKISSLGSIVVAVAHELNTPIGNALVCATAAEDGLDVFVRESKTGLRRSTLDRYFDQTREAYELIRKNLDRASGLIQSFKDTAIDRANLQRQMFAIDALLHDIVGAHAGHWQAAEVQIELQLETTVQCDSYPESIFRVVKTLVENAITHAFEGVDQKRVTIRVRECGDDRIAIDCIDNGCGIAAAHVDRVFDPFFTTRFGQGNSGLGLYQVYNLVTSVLDGGVEVASESGAGTRFSVIFPKSPRVPTA